MRVVTIMFLLFSTCCSQEEPTIEMRVDICSEDLELGDTETSFGAYIGNEMWRPNSSIFGAYYDKTLFINATDSGVLEGVWRTLDIQIDNPELGLNDVSYSSSRYLSLRQIEDRFGFTGFVSCGYVNLTKLDTVNNIISGYFQGVIKIPDDNSELPITNGVFNNLELAKLFCEPDFLEEAGNNSLYSNWRVIGIYTDEGNEIAFPPCNSIYTLTFSSNTDSVTGSIGTNSYWANYSTLSDTQIGISPIGSFRGAGANHEIYFQQIYFGVLSNSRLNYEIKNNLLTLTNSKSGKMVKYFLIK